MRRIAVSAWKKISKLVKEAVMGYVVNGLGEDADVGIACGKGKGVIFRRGVVNKAIEQNFMEVLLTEIEKL